jgi:hypothetical protein
MEKLLIEVAEHFGMSDQRLATHPSTVGDKHQVCWLAEMVRRGERLACVLGLLETHAVQHLLHLDLVHTHGADGYQLAFEVAAGHGFESGVI